jgi:hypothetical protein
VRGEWLARTHTSLYEGLNPCVIDQDDGLSGQNFFRCIAIFGAASGRSVRFERHPSGNEHPVAANQVMSTDSG